MLDINDSQLETLESLNRIMGILSAFVSVVLGFLVIYASNFMINRRKKELGIYLTLGMEKRDVSRIMLIETFLIGIIALLTGLIFGIVLSHGFSVITAKMFEIDMKEFHFIFSAEAALKTLMNFGLIFVIVMGFNTVIMTKLKIIDLIYGEKKNQELKIRNTRVSVVLFIFSVIILSTAYYTIIKNGLLDFNIVLLCVVLGCIGTFMFFVSLSGIILKLMMLNKKTYYKNLNMFVVRQINSRINTSYFSMTVICLLLFLTIGIFSTGASLSSYYNNEITDLNKFDASLYFYEIDDEYGNAEDYFKTLNPDFLAYFDERLGYSEYNTDYDVEGMFSKGDIDYELEGTYIHRVPAIKISDYNRLMEMQNESSVDLEENEYFIVSDMEEIKGNWDEFMGKNIELSINDRVLLPHVNKNVEVSIANNFLKMNHGILVLPDKIVNGLEADLLIFSGNYHKDAISETEEKVINDINMINERGDVYIASMTKIGLYEESKGMSTMLSYVGIYLGIVFLLSGASVLALQQLSESSDNAAKYLLLSKLGASKNMMSSALFKQVFIAFNIPLSLAIVHSIFGIKVVSDTIEVLGKMNILSSIMVTAGFVTLFYGSYFIFTYIGVKRIVGIK
jgi:putative ABC transport system permease protein